MKKLLSLAFLILLAVPVAYSQQETTSGGDGNQIVSVPKKYVSAEGLNYQQQNPTPEDRASKWVGIGKEIGEATKEGLNSVVDSADKFGSTKVGTFVMVMIAWKIMARDIVSIVLGVPLMLFGIFFWWMLMKRFFFGYQVLDRKEGRTKFYKRQEPYTFKSSDARCGAVWACGLSITVFMVLMLVIIF